MKESKNKHVFVDTVWPSKSFDEFEKRDGKQSVVNQICCMLSFYSVNMSYSHSHSHTSNASTSAPTRPNSALSASPFFDLYTLK